MSRYRGRMLVTSSVRRVTAAVVVDRGTHLRLRAPPTATRPKPQKSPSPATTPSELTFAVYGPKPVIAAYARIAAAYNAEHPKTRFVVKGYATHAEAKAALRKQVAEGTTPDLFLADHDDLTELMDDKAIQPVDNLLAEREVDFGDGYARTGLEAFSADARAPVHAGRRLAPGRLLQPDPDRPDDGRRAGSQPRRPEGRLVARRVRSRRSAGARPGNARALRPARPRAGRAVHLVRRWRGRRRLRRADHADAVGGRVGRCDGEAAPARP